MEALARWLADTETSQYEFARDIGVSQPTISDWLRGEKQPTADNLKLIVKRTGLSADALLGLAKAVH